MSRQWRSRATQPASLAISIMKGLLVVALILGVIGAAALAAGKIMVWAAPEPVSAAPLEVEPATPAVAKPASPRQAVTPVEPTPIERNKVGPTPAEPITPALSVADPAAPRVIRYMVISGDTLAAIAARHGLSVARLVVANGLADPDLIYVGQVLMIPTSGQVPELLPEAEDVPLGPESEMRWIDVDLSEQRVTAYEDSTAVHTTLASTGLPQTPTPVGRFRIWIKLRYDDMAGADYYIEDVPFVMYFHEGYGLHGVTWHGNFGHPMSHGCVNLPTAEAEWLFNWADVGTLVVVRA